MSVGLLLVTHQGIGAALLETAQLVLGNCPLATATLSVEPDDDVDTLRHAGTRLLGELDSGEGVLVLTDIYGSTPSNLAATLAAGERVAGVAGLNLPMLLRVLNYPEQDLDTLVEKAIEGGVRGITACPAPLS